MMGKWASILLVVLLASAATGPPSRAQARTPVDLELVLALDSSASVNATEFEIQVGGLAQAFRSPEVIEAIRQGPIGAIAVTVMEWASTDLQSMNLPWFFIDGPDAAHRLADALDLMPRAIETGATSISSALFFATELFQLNQFDGTRRAVDLSSDGRNNQGMEVVSARDLVLDRGVTINGLAILNEDPTLNIYFERDVIGGLGAFVEIANDYQGYQRAILRKLLREIRAAPIADRGPAGKTGQARVARLEAR